MSAVRTTTGVGIGRSVRLPFPEAVERVEAALGREGFGVLSRIDVQATLRAKLGQEMPPYLILGACNPPLAHRALEAEPEVGLLLPCNVVVRETPSGEVRVEAIHAPVMARLFPSPAMQEVAAEVGERLARVVESI